MKCPRCRRDATKVLNSRQRGNHRIRKRRCTNESCTYEFITTEIFGTAADNHPLLPTNIVKKDGKTEPFNRDKLLQSIRIAVRKARRGDLPIDKFVDNIEEEVSTAIDNPIDTQHIGQRVMENLRRYDKVAYLRYASIYQELDSEKSFRDLLDDITETEKK